MRILDKVNPNFRGIEGGLFTAVAKADVGGSAAALAANGVDLMAWADPFFPDPSLPEPVRDAMVQSITNGDAVHYTMPIGNVELKQEIAKKLQAYNHLSVEAQRNILITPGSDSGLFFAMLPLLSPGDEVLVPDPSYPSNFLNPQLMGAVCVPFPLDAENDYTLDISAMEARVTSKTKMVLISHPNNPTGTVFSEASLLALRDFIIRHDLVLVCDQAFEDIIFDGLQMVTPASLPGMWERTVTVFSLSKGMGLSGLRVGYIVADEHLMDIYYGCAVNVIGATNTAAQAGAIAAFRHPEILERNREALRKRRDMAEQAFSGIPGVKAHPIQSGFLSWLDVSALGPSQEVAAYLLKHARVLVNDGTAYGAQGEGHLRIVHGCFRDDQQAQEAFSRIRQALLDWKQ